MQDKLNSISIEGALESILNIGGSTLFYSFSNRDGKRWMMPTKNMSTAMNLYQPSHWKGKLVKQCLPYLYWIGFLRKLLGAEKQCYKLTDSLNVSLSNLFKIQNFEFSIFCGTPSAHQKITIQISSGDKILGYCKVTDNEVVKNSFKHEQQLLEGLSRKQIKQIPECLFSGPLTRSIEIFVQTTVKTNASKIIHQWSNSHWEFLTQLYNKTSIDCFFEETEFAQSLNILESYLSDLPKSDADVYKKAIFKVRQCFGTGLVRFSSYHADFTPWNMFYEKGELFVFDFEYSKKTYPPYLDFFHFITQTAIVDRNYSYFKIFELCKKAAEQRSFFEGNFSEIYLCYLLTIISFHFDINKNVLNMEDRCYKQWFPLINLLVNTK
jgi:hypothetical protein